MRLLEKISRFLGRKIKYFFIYTKRDFKNFQILFLGKPKLSKKEFIEMNLKKHYIYGQQTILGILYDWDIENHQASWKGYDKLASETIFPEYQLKKIMKKLKNEGVVDYKRNRKSGLMNGSGYYLTESICTE